MKIKKYWPEFLTFGLIAGTILVCMAPDMTWVNTDSDGPHYIYSAKYLYPSHKTSAPLFLLLGHLFLKLPFGTEAWRMVLLSALPTVASAGFVYLTIRHFLRFVGENRQRAYAIIGALVFGGSTLIVSQATIIETYAWVTMASTGAFYFVMKEQYKRAALMLGLGFAVHFLTSLAAIPILIKCRKQMVRPVTMGIIIAFFAFYAYIPITHREPYMWFSESNLASNWVSDNLTTGLMLIGGISIWDLPKRILDAGGILLLTFLFASPLLVYGLIKQGKKSLLTWLFLAPVVLYATNLAPQTYVYLLPTVAWGAIVIAISIPYLKVKMQRRYSAAIIGGALVMLCMNLTVLDIGRNLDPELSARKYYDEELPKVADGEVLLAQLGWEWAAIYLYNRDNNRDIIPVSASTLSSPTYQQDLSKRGVQLETFSGGQTFENDARMTKSVLEMNKNVWITQTTDPRTYGVEIVRADPEKFVIPEDPYTEGFGVKWMPSNPYDIITGAIEVEEWTYVIFSNYTVLTFSMIGVIGAVPVWVLWQVLVKKRKWSLSKQEV